MRRPSLLAAGILVVTLPSIVAAGETITYGYDARGRLVQVAHSGTVNNGVTTAYTIDKANNRTNKIVSGAGSSPPAFAVSSASATEGAPLVFTITRTGSTVSDLSVNFASANDTAVAGSDYTAVSGTLTFTPAQSSQTINVATIDDSAVEGAEAMVLNLSGATGGSTISTPQGQGAISDNDSAPVPPSFSISDATAAEGNALIFTVTKTGSTTSSFNVNFATADGTAGSGLDYTGATGTLTFSPSQTTQTISVSTIDDAAVESAETMLVNLSAATGGATISDSQGQGTISDNDVAPVEPSFSINDTAATEGNFLVFTVTRAGSTTGSLTINFATANGTAAAGDYTATSGSLTFTSGQTTRTINVATAADNLTNESDETVLVNLSGAPAGSTISDSQGVGTIINNDCPDPTTC